MAMQRCLKAVRQVVERGKQKPLYALSSIGIGLGAVAFGAQWSSAVLADASPRLTMMTWNVLARPYTKHNWQHHRANTKVEEMHQTLSRYTYAGEEIMNQGLDLVFLQECEAEFTQPEWNLVASRLLSEYEFFRCPQEPHEGPGTAVLVRRGGRARPQVEPGRHLCVGGTTDTGGLSKRATIVPVTAGSHSLLAVSGHFAWDGETEKRLRHVEMVGEVVGDRSVILAGDFNCQPGPALDMLEKSSGLLSKLRRVHLPEGTMTGLSGDFQNEVCIDHVYLSPDLCSVWAAALAKPASPWDGKCMRPANVNGASDHVPVVVELNLFAEGLSP